MRFSPIALAVALSGLSGAALADQTVNLGVLNGSIGFQNTAIAPNSTFTDTYTFELAVDSDVAASVTNVAWALSGALGIIDFAGTLAGQALTFSTTTVGPATFTLGAGSVGSLMAGVSYDLVLTGTASSMGASYGGNLIAAAVPEPQIAAMLLAGLGAMGFLTRRRQQRH